MPSYRFHEVDIHCNLLCLSYANAHRWCVFSCCILTACACVYIHECVYSRFDTRMTLASLCLRQTQSYWRNNPLSLLSVSD